MVDYGVYEMIETYWEKYFMDYLVFKRKLKEKRGFP